ncbi:MAG: hypothetical protein M0Q90_10650 [Bacteroidales bacterium]|nr:hypothetical protein [Bacteroidales bacterium]
MKIDKANQKTLFKPVKILLTALLFMTATGLMAQNPPDPPGEGANNSGNQTGGSAPIGGGLGIMLTLGAAYGARKVYQFKQQKPEEKPEINFKNP